MPQMSREKRSSRKGKKREMDCNVDPSMLGRMEAEKWRWIGGWLAKLELKLWLSLCQISKTLECNFVPSPLIWRSSLGWEKVFLVYTSDETNGIGETVFSWYMLNKEFYSTVVSSRESRAPSTSRYPKTSQCKAEAHIQICFLVLLLRYPCGIFCKPGNFLLEKV